VYCDERVSVKSMKARVRMLVRSLKMKGAMGDCKYEGTSVPCLPCGRSTSSFHTSNTVTYHMWNASSSKLISSCQQCTAAMPYTDLALKVTLPHWNDMTNKSFQTCTLLDTIHSSVAESKMTNVATTLTEERQWMCSVD